MPEITRRWSMLLMACGAALMFVMFYRQGVFSNYTILGGLLAVEVLIFAVIKYQQIFLPLLICVFLLAGVALPVQSAFLYGRWIVLGIGALAGVAIFMRSGRRRFGPFHLIAFFCILAAIVSASVSAYPDEALLKALSLTLLFLYAATGGRAAVPAFRPEVFFGRLLIACEILTLFSAISYFALRWQFFGNPNSLGAVFGVAVVPVMLWGFITAASTARRWGLGFELLVAIVLLMSSFARAAIFGSAVSSLVLCIALRRYRLMIMGTAAAVVIATAAAMFVPQSGDRPQWDGSEPIADVYLYKGHFEAGVLGSRRSVWGQTWDVIKSNPWFGSGFGTSLITSDTSKMNFRTRHIESWVVREHGNSYLAVTEWVGLLGVLPFFCLVVLALNNVRKVFAWLRRTGDAFSPAVPAAAIVCAGLIHAGFEDWMFAVGYYLCPFFWVMVFVLVDLVPRPAVVYAYPAPIGNGDRQFEIATASAI